MYLHSNVDIHQDDSLSCCPRHNIHSGSSFCFIRFLILASRCRSHSSRGLAILPAFTYSGGGPTGRSFGFTGGGFGGDRSTGGSGSTFSSSLSEETLLGTSHITQWP